MQLLPLDTFVDKPAFRMMQVHAPEEIPEVQQECQEIIDKVPVYAKHSRVSAFLAATRPGRKGRVRIAGGSY
jgi:L-fucose mutarotase/ribose pyranase (RbsD/FucU family)